MENDNPKNSNSSQVIPTAVRLVPKDDYHSTDRLNSNMSEAVENLDNCTSKSAVTSSKKKVENENDVVVETKTGFDSESFNSLCSTAAQHIRQTITDVLNSRMEDSADPPSICDSPLALEASLKEKLANFEQTCMLNNISKPPNKNEFPLESDEKTLPDLAASGDQRQNSETVSENHVLDSNCNESSNVSSDSNPAVMVRHPSFGDSSDSQSSDVGVIANKIVAPSEDNEKSHKKLQKNSNNKKKGEKTVDQILKSLSNCSTTEEKLQHLCQRHTKTLDDLRSAEARLKQNERQVIQLAREKEQLQGEHNRMVLAKSRLESLCRELQRQNKAVKEESLLRIREEEEKRKEVASKFQSTLNEISTLMQEHSQKNLQLKEENSELAKKLKALVEHYEMWEKHMEKVVHQKDLECQLAKAQSAKANLQLKQETEKFLKEKQTLLENMSEIQKKCTQLATNEIQLRGELNDYTSKYEEFQSVLNKSNQVFATFKTDMESTSKKIKKLEKETNIWKQKWENSNKSLLDMVTDKQKRDKDLLNAQQRIATLEKLCRALQAERNDLQNQVKEKELPTPTEVSE